MKRISLFLLALLFLGPIGAQTLSVKAPSQVSAGQVFDIVFELNGNAQANISVPNLSPFEVVGGPWKGTSRSFSMVNGQTSQSVTTTQQYRLRASKEGTFTIGSASCTVNNKKVSSQPVKITVVKGNANNTPQQQQQSQQQQTQQSTEIDNSKLFVRVGVNNSNPYKGEEVIITYKIYTQLSLRQYTIDKLPGIKGFWSEDLTRDGDNNQSEESINGNRYAVAEIRRGAIYGQETGSHKVDPLQMDVQAIVPVQRRRPANWFEALFDDPFFNQQQAMEKHLTSNSLNINVKPLPPVPDGKEFYGGVGTFTIESKVDQTEVKANEAITLTLTIKGNGNLMLLEAPQVAFPTVFETYEPKVNDALNRGRNGVSGSRTFEWVIIPQSAGTYTLPAIEYTWFNPKTGQYVTRTTEPIEIKVAKGAASDNMVSSKSDVKMLNNDINHIKERPGNLNGKATRVSLLQWLMLLLPIVATLIVVLMGRKRQALLSDEVTLRQHRAMKLARKRLRNAEKHLQGGNDNLFYEEIYKALWGCLSDKYSIPIAQLNHDSVDSKLTERHIPEEQHALIMATLKSVDEARFAPGDSSARKHEIYDKTLNTIAAL
ncbi:MAG: protein BatD [Bacteroidales bacterium]|nr:protein BatD [Bacteroidales bacterium]